MAKALVIVAHPDDETIWCGGQILGNPGWQWAVLSLCREKDRDRAPKFRKACKRLGVKCEISDLDDENVEEPLPSLEEVKSRIRKMLKKLRLGKSFDVLFTHGRNGEYGHRRHKEVHRAVKEMLAGKGLHAKETFFFSYSMSKRGFFCEPETGGVKPRAANLQELIGSSGARDVGAKGAKAANCNKEKSARSGASGANKGASAGNASMGASASGVDSLARSVKARAARAVVRASARNARAKRLLITSLYQFSKESFEARSACAVESFEVKRSKA